MNMSVAHLDVQSFGVMSPVRVTLDGNGAATAATINATQQTVAAMAGRAGATNPVVPAKRKYGAEPGAHGALVGLLRLPERPLRPGHGC